MRQDYTEDYHSMRGAAIGFYEQKRGLIQVWGKEAVQFLNGLITNDVAKLADGEQMSAAFPNAQGRLLATVRVLRRNDRFLFETEAVTQEKVFQNLFRFTFAGDFFVEDRSGSYRYFEIANFRSEVSNPDFIRFQNDFGAAFFVPNDQAENFINELKNENHVEVSAELYEVLRIENGTPLYAVDADETTIVPELGDDAISYNKGCYIGQEIIARIHFRGHVAKKLTGLILSESFAAAGELIGHELKSLDGKNAGRITSAAFSPTLGKFIALAYVRYDYLAEGTMLKIGAAEATVKALPFVA